MCSEPLQKKKLRMPHFPSTALALLLVFLPMLLAPVSTTWQGMTLINWFDDRDFSSRNSLEFDWSWLLTKTKKQSIDFHWSKKAIKNKYWSTFFEKKLVLKTRNHPEPPCCLFQPSFCAALILSSRALLCSKAVLKLSPCALSLLSSPALSAARTALHLALNFACSCAPGRSLLYALVAFRNSPHGTWNNFLEETTTYRP